MLVLESPTYYEVWSRYYEDKVPRFNTWSSPRGTSAAGILRLSPPALSDQPRALSDRPRAPARPPAGQPRKAPGPASGQVTLVGAVVEAEGPDQRVRRELLHDVGGPAGDSAGGEEGGE